MQNLQVKNVTEKNVFEMFSTLEVFTNFFRLFLKFNTPVFIHF